MILEVAIITEITGSSLLKTSAGFIILSTRDKK